MFINKNENLLPLAIFCVLLSFTSCKRYLDEKQNQQLITPKTTQDLQSLLDNYSLLNRNDPSALEVAADDYLITQNQFNALSADVRMICIWDNSNQFLPGPVNNWSRCYEKVYVANVVLDNLGTIERVTGDELSWNNAKGSALFIRARALSQALWIWTLAYDSRTSSTELGLPLRLDANFNSVSKRATLEETYKQIISDLKAAADLLPVTPVHVMRPSKVAAYALLARIYLSMRLYDMALVYSNNCLQLKSDLMDYNLLSATDKSPIKSFNPEIIFHCQPNQPIDVPVDTSVYNLYDNNDLRKTVFFKTSGTNHLFQGSYDGSSYSGSWYYGISTDEVYLIRSECYARSGKINEAMADLNTLIKLRWKSSVIYPVITASDIKTAISKILMERRKELLFRGIRWMDVKRLNMDGENIILKRTIGSTIYMLPQNSLKYAMAIPEDVISISGMTQNKK